MRNGWTLCLAGDVMTGRGIDQILAHPSRPEIYEGYVKDARDYVRLAESVSGPVRAPVGWDYVWGSALPVMRDADACIVNLETSVTVSDSYQPNKRIHYRMHPDNVACLAAAGIDCCVLANNHVLDWGSEGLEETLVSLERAGIRTAGAGLDAAAARAPSVLPLADGRRVLVFAFGEVSSGIPPRWAAAEDRPGVSLLADLSAATANEIGVAIGRARRPGDVVVVSVHWGANWGYAVPDARIDFAHRLIDSGMVNIVHGHSSHHPIGIERYRAGLILYGCGDLLNDYEGIGGYESFRADLSLLYRVFVPEAGSGELGVLMTPLKIRRLRLNPAEAPDAEWLAAALTRASARFGTRIRVEDSGELAA